MKVLLVAKAPVPGAVKTRLGADIGLELAAEAAAAALLDTIAACNATGAPGHLALAGDLDDGIRADDIRDLLTGWTLTPQRGDGFAERLVNAHLDAGPGVVVQIGMDTPHVTPALLLAAADALDAHDAVLGPADDGGWWVLGRRDPEVTRPLTGVRMSTSTTYADTRAALEGAGHAVAVTDPLRDVDTLADAEAVAALIPDSRFARVWAAPATAPQASR
ncbi:MAG: DUF2064 domain-containing protein [Nocardioides sp.]